MLASFCWRCPLVFQTFGLSLRQACTLQASRTPPAVFEAETDPLDWLGRWSEGPVYASAVAKDYVFFGSGGTIRVMKIDGADRASTARWTEVAASRRQVSFVGFM